MNNASMIWNDDIPLKTFSVDIKGEPPFYLEAYDNPQFEGNYSQRVTVYYGGKTELASLMSPFANGGTLFLRGRSKYGSWKKYCDSSGTPVTFICKNLGTGNPYYREITNVQDLLELSNQTLPWTGDYVLTSDIDLTGYSWKPIGGVTAFSGSFNGAGHVISGINSFQSGNPLGFFGTVNGGTIKNLGLEYGDINIGTGTSFVGGLAGRIQGLTSIYNCYVTGERLRGGNTCTGGLVGLVQNSVAIQNCFTDIVVEGPQFCGGLIGYSLLTASQPLAVNCYAAGNVFCYGTSGQPFGGFCGGDIPAGRTNPVGCVALNKRIENIGEGSGEIRFFGKSSSTAGLVETYCNKNVYGPGGTNLFSVAIAPWRYSFQLNPYTLSQTSPPFSTWDFTNTWKWDDSLNRPVLRTVGRK